MNKKAEMGIRTLIIFISLLLVAAVAAGVLIQTSGSLQEKALTTGDQAKSQISTNIKVVEVSATDGSDSYVRIFNEIIKLAPGSEPLKLSQVVLTMNTYDKTAILSYAGSSANLTNGPSGYYTLTEENSTYSSGSYSSLKNDYDLDGSEESLYNGTSGNPVYLNLSSTSDLILANCSGSTFNSMLSANDYVKSVSGTCSGTNISTITLVPKKEGKGVFAVEYLQKGSNWVNGNLQRGDVVKIYYEAPKDIAEDENIRLNFIPKVGTPTLTQFLTPNVIATERVYLYP